MPFRSVAQRDRALRQLEDGEIDQATFDRWEEGTPDELPERIGPKRAPVRERDPDDALDERRDRLT